MLMRLRPIRDEGGNAMLLAVFLTAALALLSVNLIDIVQGDSARGAQGVKKDAAFHAAEAGLNEYTAKLLEDNQYYLHDVAAGESTRKSSTTCGGSGTLVSSTSTTPTAWSYGTTWSYCSGKNNWRQLSNGYEYNIQLTGPTSSQKYVDLIATGRKQGTTAPVRVIEERVRLSSVADFQMMANANISYGATATTRGKIYAGNGSNVTHDGTAYADVYAEGRVNGGATYVSPAKKYDSATSPNIRSVIPSPINFSSFLISLTDIQRAAQNGGILLSASPAPAAWQLTFSSDGTVNAKTCTATNETSGLPPTCTQVSGFPKTVPSNGAIYANETVIIAGGTSTCTDPDGTTLTNANCVNGRVTVASNNEVVIGDDIGYVQTGDDVLGLVAKNDMIVARWSPTMLHWRAGTIAETGSWKSATGSNDATTTSGSQTYPRTTITVSSTSAFPTMPDTIWVNVTGGQTLSCTGKTSTTFTGCTGWSGSGTMSSGTTVREQNTDTATFTGSTATYGGGSMSMYLTRNYNYDDSLTYLQPPWFPTIGYGYTVPLFRELPPS